MPATITTNTAYNPSALPFTKGLVTISDEFANPSGGALYTVETEPTNFSYKLNAPGGISVEYAGTGFGFTYDEAGVLTGGTVTRLQYDAQFSPQGSPGNDPIQFVFNNLDVSVFDTEAPNFWANLLNGDNEIILEGPSNFRQMIIETGEGSDIVRDQLTDPSVTGQALAVKVDLGAEDDFLELGFGGQPFDITLGSGADSVRQYTQDSAGEEIALRIIQDFNPAEDTISLVDGPQTNFNDSYQIIDSNNGALIQSTVGTIQDVFLLKGVSADELQLVNGVVSGADDVPTEQLSITKNPDFSGVPFAFLDDTFRIIQLPDTADGQTVVQMTQFSRATNPTDTTFNKPVLNAVITGDNLAWTATPNSQYPSDGQSIEFTSGVISSVVINDYVGSTLSMLGTPREVYALEGGTIDYSLFNGDPDIVEIELDLLLDIGEPGDDIIGTTGDDVLIGTEGDDNIQGLAGNDFIDGKNGDDYVEGGDGDDIILTGINGPDYIGSYVDGGDGNDTIISSSTLGDSVSLYGGAGNDYIETGDGLSFAHGDDGDDVIIGGLDVNQLYGDNGSDTLVGGELDDLLVGGDGNDYLLGGEGGMDDFIGGDGDDYMDGTSFYDGDPEFADISGSDFYAGGKGNDAIILGDARDWILFQDDGQGTSYGADTVFGFQSGQDQVIFENASITAASAAESSYETEAGVLIIQGETSLLLDGMTLDQIDFDNDFIYSTPAEIA